MTHVQRDPRTPSTVSYKHYDIIVKKNDYWTRLYYVKVVFKIKTLSVLQTNGIIQYYNVET